MKLFAFYIGGEIAGGNLEIHDVRFCVGEAPEDCYQDLRTKWWGTPKSLHIDCHGTLEVIDGYRVTLEEKPFYGPERLYFVNLGGYDPAQFIELHRNVLLVARDEKDAKSRALKTVRTWKSPHKDDLFAIDTLLPIGPSFNSHYVHLTKTEAPNAFPFSCSYKKLS
jgi:hypothetical protein